MKNVFIIALVIGMIALANTGCKQTGSKQSNDTTQLSEMQKKVNEYAVVKLTTDMSKLTDKEKQMIPVLLEVSQIMDDIFWEQTLGDKSAFLDTIKDAATKEFAVINYGPWDRLDENLPFVAGVGKKAPGANFYPSDMTKEEFEKWNDKSKTSQYTIIRRSVS